MTTYFWLRHFSFLQYDNSVATEFPLSRQYSIHSSKMYVATLIPMSQQSFSAAFASWYRDQSFHVATVMLSCFFKLVSRPSFSCHDNISFLVLVVACLVLLSSRSRPKKSVATEFCRHLACFLVATLFLMLQPRLLCWRCFTCRDPNMLCHDNTLLHAAYFPIAT